MTSEETHGEKERSSYKETGFIGPHANEKRTGVITCGMKACKSESVTDEKSNKLNKKH